MANGKNISKTVAITTLGCKINQFESAAMSETLDKDGFRIVSFDDPADIYVINTCTVTAKTDAESRRLIRRASRQNPAARIVVTGCYAQISPDEIAVLPMVRTAHTRDKIRASRLGLRPPGNHWRGAYVPCFGAPG